VIYGGKGEVEQDVPADAPDAPDAPPSEDAPAKPEPEAAGIQAPADGIAISVNVPAEAKIFINDRATSSAGEERLYISRGLRAGATYRYVVRAEMVRDGKTIEREETVRLGAGENAELRFDFSEQVAESSEGGEAKPVATKLTVRVPAGAKVFLSDAETNATGTTREYVTHRLAQGQTWSDYVVRAEIERDGRTISSEQRISIEGGSDRELTFDFDAASVAAR
jgi:uncharacterized protein (TIGR03000 family)